MKRVLLLSLLLVVGFGVDACSYTSATNITDGEDITALVKSVYKQDTRSFVRIRIEERADNKVKYYERFFTAEVSRILTKKIVESEDKGGKFRGHNT